MPADPSPHHPPAGQSEAGHDGQDGGEGNGGDEAEEQVAAHRAGEVDSRHVRSALDRRQRPLGRDEGRVEEGRVGGKKISDGAALGTHVYGQLDNITVIRVVEENILGTLQGIGLYKGTNPFEAAGGG